MFESFFVAFFAIGGFVLASFLCRKKKSGSHQFVCPRGIVPRSSTAIIPSFSALRWSSSGSVRGVSLWVMDSSYLQNYSPGLNPIFFLASTMAFCSLFIHVYPVGLLGKFNVVFVFGSACVAIFFAVVGSFEIVLPLLFITVLSSSSYTCFMALGLSATLTDVFSSASSKIRASHRGVRGSIDALRIHLAALCFIVMTGVALYLPQAAL